MFKLKQIIMFSPIRRKKKDKKLHPKKYRRTKVQDRKPLTLQEEQTKQIVRN